MRGEDRLGEMAGAIRELTDKLEGATGHASALYPPRPVPAAASPTLLEAQAQVSGRWRSGASQRRKTDAAALHGRATLCAILVE